MNSPARFAHLEENPDSATHSRPSEIAVALGFETAPGIAVGAYLNNRVCITQGTHAFVSPHIGDLDSRAACVSFAATVSAMLGSMPQEPKWIAADLHPDFYSTRVARAFADEHHIPLVEVQHHHAHIGAVMAEHQVNGATLGLALDGYGLGSDGAAWGGELLLVDGAECTRLGHLQQLHLPGGDRAAREPWRMAAAVLHQLGRRDEIVARFGEPSSMIATMIEKELNSPRTSSAGRWFDAAAGLLGIKPVAEFEGQAAMMLETLAAEFGEVAPLINGYSIEHGVVNMMPLLAHLADMREAGHAAALFHATFAAALVDWVERAAHERDVGQVAFGGGCFQNRILSKALRAGLEARKLKVFEASQVSPGDGGLCLGQAWVAVHQLN